MKDKVILLTAGEWPTKNGLLVSQVLETGKSLKDYGYDVSWYATIPLFSFIKRLILNKDDLKYLKKSSLDVGVNFKYYIIPVTLGSPFSFWVRNFFHYRISKNIFKELEFSEFTNVVLHARSYYAAEIANLIKSFFINKVNIVTSFDMRSVLSNEIPNNHGFFGKLLYGFFKQFEYNLLKNSDVSFLPINYSRIIFNWEIGININYIPIQGLDRPVSWKYSMSERWNNKKIGYSGSIGLGIDPNLLLQVFDLFEGFKPSLATSKIPLFNNLECKLYEQNELVNYYDSLLALVIPGRYSSSDYFFKVKLRCNFFSTKATEALSMGVPLIVSEDIYELSQFVRDNKCGIVFKILDGKPVICDNIDLNDLEIWKSLVENACLIGKKFERKNVIKQYVENWNNILDNNIKI